MSSGTSGPVARMREEVRRGLGAQQKQLPPKFFYDERGSQLFERITTLPEYYLTRAEKALLVERAVPWMRETSPRSLVELGSGSAAKTRTLLDALVEPGEPAVYAPVDVSAEFLAGAARRLDAEYPTLTVRPIVADLTEPFRIPHDLPRPMVIAFLGSTIGNFERAEAVELLRQVAQAMEAEDRLLLGADLKKEPKRIHDAYNDARGVTAEFNRNALRVLNRVLGADFDVEAFDHRAFYDEAKGRVEMHLVATRPMTATISDVGRFTFAEGESIRTEISRKYERTELENVLSAAGLAIQRWFAGPAQEYALVTASVPSRR